MRNRSKAILGLWITGLCWAGDLPLYYGEFARLDGVFALTATPSQTGVTALELLELVALGRTLSIRAGAETQVGLAPGELQHPRFAQASVRVHALQRIGECGLPEALEFLQNLKRSDLGEDTTQMVWPNARVALTNARLRRIEGQTAKTEFLVNVLKGDGRGLVAHWASEQLCNQGSAAALPLIRRSISSNWSGPYGEGEIAFCESRVRVLSRDPDRAKALGSVLALDSGDASERLIRWAVDQLDSMHSRSADSELDRFGNELNKLREGMAEYGRFWGIREQVREVQARRPK